MGAVEGTATLRVNGGASYEKRLLHVIVVFSDGAARFVTSLRLPAGACGADRPA